MTRISDYCRERDAALMGDLATFTAWAKTLTHTLPSPEALEISYYRLRTACPGLPMSLRSSAKEWLLARGYKAWDDGDVPIEDEIKG